MRSPLVNSHSRFCGTANFRYRPHRIPIAQEEQQLTPIPPGICPGQIPRFNCMDEYAFQCLCRDLFDAEPGIATCEVYGVRGQSQDGIDLLAHLLAGDGIEVGQCKCYEDFPPREIRRASDEFFNHWNRWSKENVQRFILFVASDLSTRQRQDEVLKQRKRFASLGIKYEVWSAAKIQNKLRLNPGIVSTYLAPPDYWVGIICGTVPSSSLPERGVQEQISAVASTALVDEKEQLSAYLSSETEEHLEFMRKASREGRRGEAIAWLSDLRADAPKWKALSSETKAKLLNFEAGLVLDTTGDIERAQQLADQALGLAPSENQTRLRAHLAWRERGPEAAIKMLEGHDDVDSLNLKAILLLEMGHIDESLTALSFTDDGDE
jgi:tetratricopeptide (TPR) repeat protein